MMPSILAYKYARAFLNTHELSRDDLKKIDLVNKKIKANSSLLSFFEISPELKQKSADILINIFKVYDLEEFEKLILLLVNQDRITLATHVLEAILLLYKSDKKMVEVDIASTLDLDEGQKKALEKFSREILFLKENNLYGVPWIPSGTIKHDNIKKDTESKRVTSKFNYEIDKKLVAGIKLKVGYLLWEKTAQSILQKAISSLTRKYHG